MRSRIIVAKNGQTLVARGHEYVAPSQSGTTVLTSRQFEEAAPENRTYNRMRNNGDALERAWIYGNPRAASKGEVKRQRNLERAKEQPAISNDEALAIIAALKQEAERKRELAEIEKEEARLEQREARFKAAEKRMAMLMGFAKAN
jgi:hypothetical protein